jgi:hypothetical protein
MRLTPKLPVAVANVLSYHTPFYPLVLPTSSASISVD